MHFDQAMQTVFKSFQQSVRDLFLLQAQERAVRSLSPAQHQRLRSLVNAAAARSSVADNLVDPPQTVAAIVLYREAVAFLLLGVTVQGDETLSLEDADGKRIGAEFARLAEAGKIEPPSPEVDEAVRFIADSQGLTIDAAGPDVQARTRESLQAAARWLRLRLEPRTIPEIRRTRNARIGVAGAIGVVAIVWVIVQIIRPVNIALHRPVRSSSRAALSVAPADGSGLVNGVMEPNYGIQTAQQESPWVTIDLQSSHAISDIEVYNRGDGWFDEGLPLVLELSEDGNQFVEVSRRTESFTQAMPWVYTASGRRARYIRVRGPHLGYVALSEIEVHGKR
jgi:F5/8 type C domain-containing protein